jgi:hypothetical protein
MTFIGKITIIAAIFWFVPPIYVYLDASKHEESHPGIWTISFMVHPVCMDLLVASETTNKRKMTICSALLIIG